MPFLDRTDSQALLCKISQAPNAAPSGSKESGHTEDLAGLSNMAAMRQTRGTAKKMPIRCTKLWNILFKNNKTNFELNWTS